MARYESNGYRVDKRLLIDHGLDGWPTIEEHVRYTCDLEDALTAPSAYLSVKLEKDVYGRWQVVPDEKGDDTSW